MDHDDSQPSPAVSTARKSLGLAFAGGLLELICRTDVLDIRVQGVLGLLTLALLLIACVFGLLALIRINHADLFAILLPGLAGLIIGICCLFNLASWNRSASAKARPRAGQLEAARTSARESAGARLSSTGRSASMVRYELPPLEQIPAVIQKIKADAARHQGEDAAVLRAWAAHLQRLDSAFTNTAVALNRLQSANLLDPGWVLDFSDNEGVRRRGIANDFSDAWREMDRTLATFQGSYHEDLRNEQVSTRRAGVEYQALGLFLQQPEVAARIASLRKYCVVEQEIGRGYNYACGKVFDYARMARSTPELAPQFRQQMDNQLASLRQTQQTAASARQEAIKALE